MLVERYIEIEMDKTIDLASLLLHWYDNNKRELPWRINKDAYRVWISEIMLQQTRVEAVKVYYERFMKRLPNITDLAIVSDDELLKLWEGLGYYNRARNLKKAAQIVVEKNQSVFPDCYDQLIELPGIGPYTAGAIASIAFDECVPAVDGNVLRVISRIRMKYQNISDTTTKKQVVEEVCQILPQKRVGDFNQALMELGATVCLPNSKPKCHECPWEKMCLSFQNDVVDQYPSKLKKQVRKIEKKTILILLESNQVAIKKRPDKGLLADLYEFPVLEGKVSSKKVIQYLKDNNLISIKIQKLKEAKHIFSHIEWHMIGYLVTIQDAKFNEWGYEDKMHDYIFVEPKEVEKKYPIPTAYKEYAKYLSIQVGKDGKSEMK